METIFVFKVSCCTFAPIMREKILSNAAELFLNYGFKSITMDDISNHIGISKKTIYQHFGKQAVYLDYAAAIERYGKTEASKKGLSNVSHEEIIALGKEVVKEKYGNLFDMYAKITGDNPYEVPMRIYPAVHYTMGGLWVDYELQTSVPGLYALGEANFSDHGANRLGASALMQGLADGYFVIPYTLGNNLADEIYNAPIPTTHPAFEAAEKEGIAAITINNQLIDYAMYRQAKRVITTMKK